MADETGIDIQTREQIDSIRGAATKMPFLGDLVPYSNKTNGLVP